MATVRLEFDLDSDLYPELHAALVRLGDAGLRGERIRQLAAAGLVWENVRIHGAAAIGPNPAVPPPVRVAPPVPVPQPAPLPVLAARSIASRRVRRSPRPAAGTTCGAPTSSTSPSTPSRRRHRPSSNAARHRATCRC